jgi:hypothetical protein
MDWKIITETVSIGGLSVVAIYLIFKMVVLFMEQWQNSTEAVNKNTGAFTQLSEVLERSNQREMEFQERALAVLQANNELAKDTNEKVSDIQRKIG